MASFDSGVFDYVRCYAVVEVNFPIDEKGRRDVSCRHCPYLSSNERMCQLTKSPVAYPSRYVGQNCPLIEKEESTNVQGN